MSNAVNAHPDEDLIDAQIHGEPIDDLVIAREPLPDLERDLAEVLNRYSAEGMLGGNTPDFVLANLLVENLKTFGVASRARDAFKAKDEQSNFGFYVDGYTMAETGTIGEVRVTSYDGRTGVFPSKMLTAFLERRLTPPNVLPETD